MTAARRLAAIVAADYCLMDEERRYGSVARRSSRSCVRAAGSSKTIGDGVLEEFPSVFAAVECGLADDSGLASAGDRL
jgi:hypothetical protein